jgi:hypothetical protein
MVQANLAISGFWILISPHDATIRVISLVLQFLIRNNCPESESSEALDLLSVKFHLSFCWRLRAIAILNEVDG